MYTPAELAAEVTLGSGSSGQLRVDLGDLVGDGIVLIGQFDESTRAEVVGHGPDVTGVLAPEIIDVGGFGLRVHKTILYRYELMYTLYRRRYRVPDAVTATGPSTVDSMT